MIDKVRYKNATLSEFMRLSDHSNRYLDFLQESLMRLLRRASLEQFGQRTQNQQHLTGSLIVLFVVTAQFVEHFKESCH